MNEQNPPGQAGDPGQSGAQTQSPPAPEAQSASGQGPRVSGEQMRDLNRLRRSTWDKHVAGVAGGLGRHFDVDPVIVRVAFVVLTFFGGSGLLVYGALWLLVPDDREDVVFRLDPRSRNVALIGVGVLAGLAMLGDAFGPGWGGWFPWPLLIIGLVAWVILSRRDRPTPPPGAPGAHAPTAYPHSTQQFAPSQAGPAGPTGPVPPPAPPRGQPYRPQPRNPRKRGPILFWFTLGLIALGIGTLGIVDLAGANIVGSAYPALALGIIAVMLLVGAFYGRAGGLILLGLITALGLTVGTVVDRWDGHKVHDQPVAAAELRTSYDISAGEVVLDLTRVEDLTELDGEVVDIDIDLGRIEIIVPEDLTVHVNARVHAGGDIRLFGQHSDSGWDHSFSRTHRGPSDAPELTIDARIGFGEITARAR